MYTLIIVLVHTRVHILHKVLNIHASEYLFMYFDDFLVDNNARVLVTHTRDL